MTHRFIQALHREPIEHRPIWLMRQAGRYLPEYRALRAQVPDFMTFCKTPELACTVTLQPLARFDLDAAIIFSDILTIPQAMGMDLAFVKNEGPVFQNPLRDANAIAALCNPDADETLGYVAEAIRLVKPELNDKVPLIGFAGSPWTLACYMIEGHGSKLFLEPRKMMYQAPALLISLLEKLTEVTVAYLNMQVAAGADVLMLFDSWGGLLSTAMYQQFSLRFMHEILNQVNRERDGKPIPMIMFTKGGSAWLELMADCEVNALGCDWTIDIGIARQRVGDRVALQGNLDPAVLLSTPEQVQQETRRILESYGNNQGHIFNLGHGIDQHTPIENVHALIETVRNFDAKRVNQ